MISPGLLLRSPRATWLQVTWFQATWYGTIWSILSRQRAAANIHIASPLTSLPTLLTLPTHPVVPR